LQTGRCFTGPCRLPRAMQETVPAVAGPHRSQFCWDLDEKTDRDPAKGLENHSAFQGQKPFSLWGGFKEALFSRTAGNL